MSKNILLVVDSVSNELDVKKEVIFKAIEAALAAVTAKKFEEEVDIRVVVDRDTGDYEAFRRWEVCDESILPEKTLEFPEKQMSLDQAHEIDDSLVPGDFIEEKVEAEAFGRIGAYQAKQIISRIVREAGRAKIAEEYKDRIGELLTGQVKRVVREGIVVDLGSNIEGFIARDHLIPRESFRTGDRVRACLYTVSQESKGPQLLLSRTAPDLLAKLFEVEVPEIAERIITIESVARDPGSRSKVAVKTNDGRIDPIGACLGIRCARLQAVSAELNGERVEVVLWDGDPAQFVINALAPADVTSIVIDEQMHAMDIAVPEDNLPKAIGRGGQNVSLASRLTGWTLNILSEKMAAEKSHKHMTAAKTSLTDSLDIDEEVAELLIQEGFSSIEDIAYVAIEELLSIEGFDQDIVDELRDRAKQSIAKQELVDTNKKEAGHEQDRSVGGS